MSWECSNCGNQNEEGSAFCGKCDLNKEAVMVVVQVKRRRTCEECGHIHREGVFCHVFVEAAEDDGADDYISESESSNSSDDSDDLSIGVPKRILGNTSGKQGKMKPLLTPKLVKHMGYIRCNCNIGVPSENKRFEPIQRYVYVGPIQVQTYAEINYSSDKARYEQTLLEKYPESQAGKRALQRITDIAQNLPIVLSYLPLGSCSKVPQVSTYWNWGTSLYQRYIDMRNCFPWQVRDVLFASTYLVGDSFMIGTLVYTIGLSAALLPGGLSACQRIFRLQRWGPARAGQRLCERHGHLHCYPRLWKHSLPVRKGCRIVHLLYQRVDPHLRAHPHGTEYQNGTYHFE